MEVHSKICQIPNFHGDKTNEKHLKFEPKSITQKARISNSKAVVTCITPSCYQQVN